jgi:hypothetical protein
MYVYVDILRGKIKQRSYERKKGRKNIVEIHGLWKYKRCSSFHSLGSSIVCEFN